MRKIRWIVFVLCLVLCGCSRQLDENSDESGVSIAEDSWSDSQSSVEKEEGSTESVDDSDINYAGLIQETYGSAMVQLEGGGLQHIVKQLGSSGTADPLNQRATAGWKLTKVAERLVEQYMVRIESASTFESGSMN